MMQLARFFEKQIRLIRSRCKHCPNTRGLHFVQSFRTIAVLLSHNVAKMPFADTAPLAQRRSTAERTKPALCDSLRRACVHALQSVLVPFKGRALHFRHPSSPLSDRTTRVCTIHKYSNPLPSCPASPCCSPSIHPFARAPPPPRASEALQCHLACWLLTVVRPVALPTCTACADHRALCSVTVEPTRALASLPCARRHDYCTPTHPSRLHATILFIARLKT